MSEQHLAVRLARRRPVLWVDPAISWLTPLRSSCVARTLREPRLRPVANDLLRLTPVTVPGVSRPGLRRIARAQVARAARRALEHWGGPPAAATVVASPDDLLRAVPTGRTVFYGTDDYLAGAGLMGLGSAWLAERQRAQLREADIVIAVSDVLAHNWSRWRRDIHVIPNGCDSERFASTDSAPLPSDVCLPGPIAGFVGTLNDRIDLDLLHAVADRGVSLLLVGGCSPTFCRSRLDGLLSRPCVQWVGRKEFEEMPSYLRVIDVGLTPYGDSAFNRASSPLKTLEYLAAGRAAVVTDLPAVRRLGTHLVTVARTPVEFADSVQFLLGSGSTDRQVAERREFAARHSWAERADRISELMRHRTA
jgi:teichuronic acid biosynthesis glycosyltransferase TuaH